jgi:hypothetical protein
LYEAVYDRINSGLDKLILSSGVSEPI